MQLNPYRDLPWEQLMPTARRKLLCSDKDYMFVLMECKAGTAQPPHSHPHTQVVTYWRARLICRWVTKCAVCTPATLCRCPAMCPTLFAGSTGIPAGWNSSPLPERTFCPGKNRKKKNNSNPLAPLVTRGALFLFCLFQ